MLTVSMILICVLVIINCMSSLEGVQNEDNVDICDDQLSEHNCQLYDDSYVGWRWETIELESDSEWGPASSVHVHFGTDHFAW